METTVEEMGVAYRDLGVGPSDNPFSLDDAELQAFLERVTRSVALKHLDIGRHGIILQVEPLVALLKGSLEHVRRTAMIPVADVEMIEDFETLTLPGQRVLRFDLPFAVSVAQGVSAALEACRTWTLSDESHLVGNTLRMHVIPDARSPDGVRTALTVERLHPTADEV